MQRKKRHKETKNIITSHGQADMMVMTITMSAT